MPERGVEQRGRYYHTRHHTTHLNGARYRDNTERFLFMVANSQGQELVVLSPGLEVERRIPSVDGWIQDAMPLPDGTWLIADVNRFRLVIQDDAGTVVREYPFNQD